MATSGTVAKTVIDTSTLLEHAFRRVKVAPSAQTPETIEIAKNCLYMLMLNRVNRTRLLAPFTARYADVLARRVRL